MNSNTSNPYASPAAMNPESDAPAMDCPSCGAAMELGYFPSAHGVYWRRPEQGTLAISAASALPGTLRFVRSAKIGGFRCAECELVVFRYGSHMIDISSA